MKRINDNTIQVTLGVSDLQKRGVSVLDLIGNHGEIEKFFYSILEEVDTDNQFADTDAVTFQMIPAKNGGLELLISKNTAQENQDLNQENGSYTTDDLQETKLDDQGQASQQDSDDEDLKALSSLLAGDSSAPQPKPSRPKARGQRDLVYEYGDLKAVVNATKLAAPTAEEASLYLLNNRYYLDLKVPAGRSANDLDSFGMTVARLAEYGRKTNFGPLTLGERGQCLIKDTALQGVAKYF